MANLTPPRLIARKPLARSRALRRDSTAAERTMWSIIENRKLEGWKFRRQVVIDSLVVDFCCIEARLIVELDGEQHAGARKRYDDVRTRELVARGFKVLRFWNGEVLRGAVGVAEEIGRMLSAGRAGKRHDGGQNPHLPAARRPASSPVK
jgi:very-short-patch-repair endonuclease